MSNSIFSQESDHQILLKTCCIKALDLLKKDKLTVSEKKIIKENIQIWVDDFYQLPPSERSTFEKKSQNLYENIRDYIYHRLKELDQ